MATHTDTADHSDTMESRPAIQAALLAAWDQGHRDLPWRRTRDPYAILVSELMLQQTQVERVVPKWEAFMRRFPSLVALAVAEAADVIRMWQGLGYNRRAVNLHRLARDVVERHGGTLPADVVTLASLPGIGPYTARAVASIAYGAPAAAVDTNVRRVLTRIINGSESDQTTRAVQELADKMLVRERPGDWNQQLMEHGALVCTAVSPRCDACAVRSWCTAAPAIRAVRERGGNYRVQSRSKQGPYAGSNRFYRGRIIDLLRVEPKGLSPDEIGRRLRLDYCAEDRPWIAALLAGLARDMLITWPGDDASARLGG